MSPERKLALAESARSQHARKRGYKIKPELRDQYIRERQRLRSNKNLSLEQVHELLKLKYQLEE